MKIIIALLSLLLSTNSLSKETTVPPEMFFSYPDMVTATLSPNGEKITAIRIIEREQHLVLISTDSLNERILLSPKKYAQKDAVIRKIVWLDNRYLAVQFSELRKGVEDLLDSKISRRLLIIDTHSTANKNNVLSVRTKGWIAHPQPQSPGKFLYAKSGAHSKIYSITISELSPDNKKLGKLDKIDGGQFKKSNELISIEGYATRWFWGNDNKIRASLSYNRKQELKLTLFDENQKKTVDYSIKNKDGAEQNKYLMPIAVANTASAFYCLDFNETENRSVYRVDFSKDSQELVHEISAYEIIDLLISDTGDLLGVQVQKDGAIAYEYINESKNIRDTSSITTNSSALVSVYDVSDDATRLLAYTESHKSPGEFVLLNKNIQRIRSVGKRIPKLSNKFKTTLITGALEVDDLSIPYLLTLPEPTSAKPYPLVVMPHGGPIGVHDDHYYDQATHFVNANGYAVLRVNFRGSSGHSAALKEAGTKEWGGKMLSDIHGAVVQVLTRGDIDSQSVCAFGFSYGGYASTMLAIQHPNTYKCAVTVGGVSDVNLFLNSPNSSASQKKWLKEHVGDPASDYDYLKTISPVYIVDKLTSPILVAHGLEDRVVDVEHAYRTKMMLKKHNKEFEWYLDEKSGHHFSNPEHNISLFAKIIEFLNRNI